MYTYVMHGDILDTYYMRSVQYAYGCVSSPKLYIYNTQTHRYKIENKINEMKWNEIVGFLACH